MIRRVTWTVLALACLLPGRAQSSLPPGVDVNGISVVVNDDVITRDDVLSYIARTVQLLARQYQDRPDELDRRLRQAQRDGLEQLIERKLILHEFKTAGYNLPDSVVEEEIQKRIRERFGGDRVALAHTLQSEGLTMEAWREQIREEYIISAMRARQGIRNIIISPYKIEKYYAEHLDEFKLGDQVKLRTLMLDARAMPRAGMAKELARELLKQIEGGASFADLARIYSQDSFREKGGDRGWIERDALRKELSDVAFSLKPGEHSGVIDLGGTVWLLEVEAVRKNYIRTLPEVRDEIEARLKAQEQARLQKQWINRLRKKSYIQYY
jgi:peptidyl-prolyl cis-trans isomerase SurA